MIGWRLYAVLALAALLAGAVYHDHLGWQRAKANSARAAVAESAFMSERAARASEQADRSKADASAIHFDDTSSGIRGEPAIAGVRVCPAVPRTARQGRAAAIPDETPTGRVESPPAANPDAGIDVSVEVDAYGTDCAITAAQLLELQTWERGRDH